MSLENMGSISPSEVISRKKTPTHTLEFRADGRCEFIEKYEEEREKIRLFFREDKGFEEIVNAISQTIPYEVASDLVRDEINKWPFVKDEQPQRDLEEVAVA